MFSRCMGDFEKSFEKPIDAWSNIDFSLKEGRAKDTKQKLTRTHNHPSMSR